MTEIVVRKKFSEIAKNGDPFADPCAAFNACRFHDSIFAHCCVLQQLQKFIHFGSRGVRVAEERSMTLFPSLRSPEPPPGIDLRRCDVAEMLADVRGARLIVADPPWAYDREAGVANPGTRGIFDVLTMDQIVAHLDAAHDAAGPACRLAVWYTWPKAAEWTAAGLAGPRWGSVVTGGIWTGEPGWSGGLVQA
jgi:hypothetical protein